MLRAGVVDQDVEAADRVLDRGDAGDDCRGVGDVEGDGMNGPAGPCGQVTAGLLQALLVPAVEHDHAARLEQPGGQGAPEALARAGDQSGPPGDVEETMAHGSAFR